MERRNIRMWETIFNYFNFDIPFTVLAKLGIIYTKNHRITLKILTTILIDFF